MLETLKIRNIAIIDEAEIRFTSGLNILSGETGAGKSIILDAISLILGSRANTELIRAGAEEASVEGFFDLSDIKWVRARLEKLGLDSDCDELLIKRTVHRGGKHRIHVNGELATLTMLQELCAGLVDLCSQHEHQSLIRPSVQLELLDRYGGLTDQARSVSEAFHKARALAGERDELQAAENGRAQRADFLRFQIAELSEARLEPGEDAKLQAEKQLLQSGEQRVTLADAAARALEDDEDGVMAGLRGAIAKLRQLRQLDERAGGVLDTLERANAEVEEASLSLSRYLGNVDLDPERMAEVQERLSLIADLRRKYGASVEAMLETLGKLEAELAGIEHSGERLEKLGEELKEAEAALLKIGKKLSQARKKVSETLADSVTGELKDLRMSGAKFSIELSSSTDLSAWNASGGDQIQFVVQTNPGEPARPLGKIASGGELSRLMLAIRRVIADRGGIGVYLFDEIDAGIGGQTAFQVGKKLKSVARHNQVICITHLPQVASFADQHLVVQKSTQGKRTKTEIVELSKTQRREELARMLGGPQLTKKSLENAAELLELAR